MVYLLPSFLDQPLNPLQRFHSEPFGYPYRLHKLDRPLALPAAAFSNPLAAPIFEKNPGPELELSESVAVGIVEFLAAEDAKRGDSRRD